MSKKNKTRTNKKGVFFASLLCVAISLAFAWFGFATSFENAYSFSQEKADVVYVNSTEDLDLAGAFYNDVCYLQSDIEIGSFNALTKPDRPFVGLFDGLGHTLTFTNEVSDALFGYIGEGGVVRNCNIVLDCTLSSDFLAVLAYENRGTIEDCKISGKILLPESGVSSALVVANRGVIRHVVMENVNVKRISSDGKTASSVYGGLCAYNYGSIENIISNAVSFDQIEETERENVFENGLRNYGVGCIFGVDRGGTVTGLVETVSSQYLSDAGMEHVVYTEDFIKMLTADYVTETLEFDLTSVWKFENKRLDLGGSK